MMTWRRFLKDVVAAAILVLTFACETSSDGGGNTTTDHGGSTAGDTTGDATTSDTGGGGGGGDCETFCADMVAACPEDDTMETCMHSCEMAVSGAAPSATALECAAAAMECTAVRACWGELF